MTLDTDVIRPLLARLNDHIERVERKRPASIDALLTDRDAQDIVSHNLEKAVQICIDVASHVCAAQGRAPETSGDALRVLAELGLLEKALADKLVSAVGFRNVSVHQYAQVDWTIVARIVENDMQGLKDFGRWACALATKSEPPESAGRAAHRP